MKDQYSAQLLREAWVKFLQRKGHQVHVSGGITDAITSYRKEHNSFRWLLFISERRTKELTPSEWRQLAGEIDTARERSERPFVVVRFSDPEPKLIITPAENVLETGRIGSARGGIPWFE